MIIPKRKLTSLNSGCVNQKETDVSLASWLLYAAVIVIGFLSFEACAGSPNGKTGITDTTTTTSTVEEPLETVNEPFKETTSSSLAPPSDGEAGKPTSNSPIHPNQPIDTKVSSSANTNNTTGQHSNAPSSAMSTPDPIMAPDPVFAPMHPVDTKTEESEAQQLLDGKISTIKGATTHHIPDSMTINKGSYAYLSIGRMADLDTLIEMNMNNTGATKDDIIVGENITLGRIMKAKLDHSGDSNDPPFQIKMISEEEQVVDLHNDKNVTWNWKITPYQSGEFDLIFTLSVMYEIGSREKWKSYEVYKNKVKVHTSPNSKIANVSIGNRGIDSNEMEINTLVGKQDKDDTLSKSQFNRTMTFAGVLVGLFSLLGFVFFRRRQKNGLNGIDIVEHKENIDYQKLAEHFNEEDSQKMDKLISKSEIKAILSFLLTKIPEANREEREDIQLYQSEFSKNERDRQKNIITNEVYDIRYSRISDALINIVGDLKGMS